jgi:hypothetical protein
MATAEGKKAEKLYKKEEKRMKQLSVIYEEIYNISEHFKDDKNAGFLRNIMGAEEANSFIKIVNEATGKIGANPGPTSKEIIGLERETLEGSVSGAVHKLNKWAKDNGDTITLDGKQLVQSIKQSTKSLEKNLVKYNAQNKSFVRLVRNFAHSALGPMQDFKIAAKTLGAKSKRSKVKSPKESLLSQIHRLQDSNSIAEEVVMPPPNQQDIIQQPQQVVVNSIATPGIIHSLGQQAIVRGEIKGSQQAVTITQAQPQKAVVQYKDDEDMPPPAFIPPTPAESQKQQLFKELPFPRPEIAPKPKLVNIQDGQGEKNPSALIPSAAVSVVSLQNDLNKTSASAAQPFLPNISVADDIKKTAQALHAATRPTTARGEVVTGANPGNVAGKIKIFGGGKDKGGVVSR